MKLVKKKAALLFLLVVISLILTACGKLSGKYYLKDSYGMQYLEFNGDQVTITTFGIPVSGTYKIKGNQMTVKTNVLGYESETPYSFSKSGNAITFEGQTYIKSGSSGVKNDDNTNNRLGMIILIVCIVLVLAGVVFIILKRRSRNRSAQIDYSEIEGKVTKASKDLYVSAAEVGNRVASSVSTGVSAGVAAGKAGVAATRAAAREYQASCQAKEIEELFTGDFYDKWEEVKDYETDSKKRGSTNARQSMAKTDSGKPQNASTQDDADEWEEVSAPVKPIYTGRHSPRPKTAEPNLGFSLPSFQAIPITTDHCCICGRPLGEDATPLAGLPSGAEAYIDRNCHKVLTTAASTDDVSEFNAAAKYLRSRIQYVDPELAQAMTRFIQKGEARLHLDEFSF